MIYAHASICTSPGLKDQYEPGEAETAPTKHGLVFLELLRNGTEEHGQKVLPMDTRQKITSLHVRDACLAGRNDERRSTGKTGNARPNTRV